MVTLKDFTLIDDSTETGILNSIKEGFQKLWEWLKGIWDSIKEIPTKIAASLTALGDRIRTFFLIWSIICATFFKPWRSHFRFF